MVAREKWPLPRRFIIAVAARYMAWYVVGPVPGMGKWVMAYIGIEIEAEVWSCLS